MLLHARDNGRPTLLSFFFSITANFFAMVCGSMRPNRTGGERALLKCQINQHGRAKAGVRA